MQQDDNEQLKLNAKHGNPYLTQTNPYQSMSVKSVLAMNEVQKAQQEFERLCYEVFIGNKIGAALLIQIQQKFINVSQLNPTEPNAAQMALYWEGFRAALIGLEKNAKTHEERINKPR